MPAQLKRVVIVTMNFAMTFTEVWSFHGTVCLTAHFKNTLSKYFTIT